MRGVCAGAWSLGRPVVAAYAVTFVLILRRLSLFDFALHFVAMLSSFSFLLHIFLHPTSRSSRTLSVLSASARAITLPLPIPGSSVSLSGTAKAACSFASRASRFEGRFVCRPSFCMASLAFRVVRSLSFLRAFFFVLDVPLGDFGCAARRCSDVFMACLFGDGLSCC